MIRLARTMAVLAGIVCIFSVSLWPVPMSNPMIPTIVLLLRRGILAGPRLAGFGLLYGAFAISLSVADVCCRPG